MYHLDKSIQFNIAMAFSGIIIVLTGIFIEETRNIAWASLASLAISILFIIIATNIFRKNTTQKTRMMRKDLTTLFRDTYAPNGFSKQHLAAIVSGVVIGGFMSGSVIGLPKSGQPWWPAVAAILIGALVGAFFVLSLVGATKRPGK